MNTQQKAQTRRRGKRTVRVAAITHRDQDLVDLVIMDFPAVLKARLVKEAAKQKTNMTDVAVAALADTYGIPFVPSGRRSPVMPGESEKVSLSMPRKLRKALSAEAVELEMPKHEVAIGHLAVKFLTKRELIQWRAVH
jgi:hypothetical protein